MHKMVKAHATTIQPEKNFGGVASTAGGLSSGADRELLNGVAGIEDRFAHRQRDYTKSRRSVLEV
jgi:hypothetical protein